MNIMQIQNDEKFTITGKLVKQMLMVRKYIQENSRIYESEDNKQCFQPNFNSTIFFNLGIMFAMFENEMKEEN